jgi:hypothetical protein
MEKKSLCHDCLKPYTSMSELYHVDVVSTVGPEYSIFACESCAKKRNKNIKKLETAREYIKRLNSYLGLKS